MHPRHLLLATLLVILTCAPAAAGTWPQRVRLDSGPISGLAAQKGVRAYLGIPYAAPPVGALRWEPPQPPAKWTAVRPCATFGPACPQPGETPGGSYSEDCLYLNVWTPAKTPAERLPVMVWIHGGAFNFGSAAQSEYRGADLAGRGVVVVTLNYRLGPLGFFVHPALSARSPRGVSGNYGLLDQIAALKWARRNIKAFGGDAGNVTIFGQSAGSRSVSLLLLSPLARELFVKAIAESGGPIVGSEYLSPDFAGDLAAVSRMGEKLAERLGCAKAADPIAALRAKSADEIVRAAKCSTSLFTRGLFFAPAFDGAVLPKNPVTALRAGLQHHVPVIVGSTLDEGNLYLKDEHDLTLARYEEFLRARFGAQTPAALAMFPAKNDAAVHAAIDRVIAVGANAQPARFTARMTAKAGRKAFLHRFSRKPDTKAGRALGAFHGVDLAYVFGNLNDPGYTDVDRRLSRTVMSYWVNFAKNGDPNGPGLPAWPVCTPTGDAYMEFGDVVRAGAGLDRAASDFIEAQWRRTWER